MEKRNHTGGDPIFAFCSHAVGGNSRAWEIKLHGNVYGHVIWVVFSQLACLANQQITDC